MSVSLVQATRPLRWAVDVPGLRYRGFPVQLAGNQPSWYSAVYFAGLAGLTRVLLTVVATNNLLVTIAAYSACVVLGPIIGKVLPRRGEIIARVFSGCLGMAGVSASSMAPILAPHLGQPSATVAVVPVVATALVLLINCAGALMCRFFPEEPAVEETPARPKPRKAVPALASAAPKR